MFPKVPQSSLGILRVSQLHVVNCGGDYWEVGQPRAYGFAFLAHCSVMKFAVGFNIFTGQRLNERVHPREGMHSL